jgi:hydroxymethylpyrimidine pyrophosphatase-like HAD family hydrolase
MSIGQLLVNARASCHLTPSTHNVVVEPLDGTLMDSKNWITERAKAAIQKLTDAGIKFAVASARSPRGMTMIADEITLSAPIAAFNGGMLSMKKRSRA